MDGKPIETESYDLTPLEQVENEVVRLLRELATARLLLKQYRKHSEWSDSEIKNLREQVKELKNNDQQG